MIHARDNTHNPRSVKLLLEISVSVFLPVCVCVREGNRWCFIQREHQIGIEIYSHARFDNNHREFRFRSKTLRNSKSKRSYWSKATQGVYISYRPKSKVCKMIGFTRVLKRMCCIIKFSQNYSTGSSHFVDFHNIIVECSKKLHKETHMQTEILTSNCYIMRAHIIA